MAPAQERAKTAIDITFGDEDKAVEIARQIQGQGLRDAVVVTVERIGVVLKIVVETAKDMALVVYGRVKDMLSYSDSLRCSCRAVS